jgi:uncharacterized protein
MKAMPSTASLPRVQAQQLKLSADRVSLKKKKIWVDLDNSPHVPFFRPIIKELRDKNYDVFVTARDAYQVRQLVDFYGVDARIIGKHYGKHKILKAWGTCWRALALAPIVKREKPDLAICHGSRSLLIASALFGVRSVVLMDYEFGKGIPGFKPTWLMVPSVVSGTAVFGGAQGIIKYPGIKEDVYLSTFQPDRSLRKRLGINADELVVTVRPPATEAHYHNPEGEKLLSAALSRFVGDAGARIILLPRNKRQEDHLRSAWADAIATEKILIPQHVEDGLNLIWNSDLVISGGGTMNREAAAMGVPVYSIFRGKIGAVDRYLAEQGRMVLIETEQDVQTKIQAVRRDYAEPRGAARNNATLEAVVETIISIAESKEILGVQN